MRLLICAAAAVLLVGCGSPRQVGAASADPFVLRGNAPNGLQERSELLADLAYTIAAARACFVRGEAWAFYLTARVSATVAALAEEMPHARPGGAESVKAFLDGVVTTATFLGRRNVATIGLALCPVIGDDPTTRVLDETAR